MLDDCELNFCWTVRCSFEIEPPFYSSGFLSNYSN